MIRVGITRYAADKLKDINLIQVQPVGTILKRMTPLGVVESVKAVSDIITPVSGVIKSVNEALWSQPWLVNYYPYGDGWIIIMEPANLEEEAKTLLRASDYCKMIKEEVS